MKNKFNIHQFGSSLEKDSFKKFLPYLENCNSVLDIGCGQGVFLELLEETGIKGIGIDIDELNIQTCKWNNLEVLQMDAIEYLSSTKNRFDAVFCSHIIEHYNGYDAVKLISESCKVLKKNGVMIIVTPNPSNLRVITEIFWMDITHIRPYPLPLLKQILSESGLEIIHAEKEKLEKWYDFYRIFWDKIRNLFLNGKYYGEGDIIVIGKKTN